ncbi:MAG: hypothetical protein JKY54_10625, partial [Flavobacteriales bacterium]|nr:hypothetical protein [Flavobacteriales bacterium]
MEILINHLRLGVKLSIYIPLFLSIVNGYSQIQNNGNLRIHSGASIGFHTDFTNDGGILTVDENSTLTSLSDIENKNSATLDINGTLKITGDLINTATFDQDTGLVEFNGTTLQLISGNHTFFEVVIKSSDSIHVNSGLQQIRKTLFLDNGVLQTNDSLLLISDINRTARIAEITGGDITGDIIMQRYIDAGPNGFHMLGSACTGQTLNDLNDDFITSGFTGSDYPGFPFTSIWWYDETLLGSKSVGWTAPNITDSLLPGQGAHVYLGPVPLTLDVKGPAAKGDIDMGVTFSSSGDLLEDGWNFLANPYPSTIDWDAITWVKTNIDNAVYTWDADNQV